MPKNRRTPPVIADLFRIPTRFLRSVQLERDFHDVAALEHYIVTPSMAEAFRRIAEGLRTNSGRRAWRVTGDYGVGKSSFALVLAHLLYDRSPIHIAEAIGLPAASAETPPMLPILVTGSRQGIVSALARGIAEALRQRKSGRGRILKGAAELIEKSEQIERENDTVGLESLVEELQAYANASEGAGLLLIVDELGKLLEYASLRPDREDVFVLQRLAEMAVRSGDRPFVLLGLLHQGFHAYAERLPLSIRHEWDKVAGRFDEIVFDQPLAHTAALVAGALNLDAHRLPSDILAAARSTARATAVIGWLGGAATGAATLDAASLYPIHPTLLPILVRFFARFGQHERSLFGFLLSSEPFGLQVYSARRAASDAWYGLAEFYDYIRAMFGHRLAGASYRNHWLRIVATIDSAADLNNLEERAIKAVAVLNLLDAEDLLATDRAIAAAFAPLPECDVEVAIRALLDRGLLFRRGTAGNYRLWPNSSVNLEAAFQSAILAIGTLESVSANLEPFLDSEPVLARRHYIERGTLRYFEVRYAHVVKLTDIASKPTDADGLILVALADTEPERLQAIQSAIAPPFRARPDILVAVIQPLLSLTSELHDLQCWQWLADNTPELANDAYAGAEVSRQLTTTRRALSARLATLVGFRGGTAAEVSWFRAGQPVVAQMRGGLSSLLSDICDQLYPDAPRIMNELLNRNALSSAAAAARMRLIEGIFNAADRPLLGIDPAKAPPEKSMYLSVLEKGRVHIREADRYKLVEPLPQDDHLWLRPALAHIVYMVENACGERVSAAKILSSLKKPPFGIRAGVAPLLLAIVLRTRAHELAVYEHGTFLHRFGPPDFLRLTKLPSAFEIQHCQVEGVRVEVFRLLAAVFATGITERPPDLLDVVTPLCRFAAQLPEYTRKSGSLSPTTQGVRDALLSAREPVTLLFQDLPGVFGIGAFSPQQSVDHNRVRHFVNDLEAAVNELRAAYQQLIGRIVERVAEAIGDGTHSLNRGHLAARAARVSLVAREPRLRTFALRLRDPGLSDDAWAEALASFVIGKPPARWASSDEARFCEEIAALAETFRRLEAVMFEIGSQRSEIAMRLNLTRSDGYEVMRVIEMPAKTEAMALAVLDGIKELLPQDRRLRLEVLTQLLWADLATAADHSETSKQPTGEQNPKRAT